MFVKKSFESLPSASRHAADEVEPTHLAKRRQKYFGGAGLGAIIGGSTGGA
jgi:hypothetical protein